METALKGFLATVVVAAIALGTARAAYVLYVSW